MGLFQQGSVIPRRWKRYWKFSGKQVFIMCWKEKRLFFASRIAVAGLCKAKDSDRLAVKFFFDFSVYMVTQSPRQNPGDVWKIYVDAKWSHYSLQSQENFQRLIPSFKSKLTAVKQARWNTAPPVAPHNTQQGLRPSTANTKTTSNYRSSCALAGQMASLSRTCFGKHSFVLDLFVTFWGKAKK